MNLIILSEADRIADNVWRIDSSRAEHVRGVLRAEVGDTVQIGLIDGPVGVARVTRITAEEVLLEGESLADQAAPRPTIDLVCALPRPQTLKKVLFTAAMMGVRRLHLIRANRVEKSYFNSPLLQERHFTPHLVEGLAQGSLTRLPRVAVHNKFRPFVEETLPALDQTDGIEPLRLLPERASNVMLDTIYAGGESTRLVIAIGPEGGWVPFEIDLMEARGFRQFSLGRPILRVEHAVTAVLAQIELLRGR